MAEKGEVAARDLDVRVSAFLSNYIKGLGEVDFSFSFNSESSESSETSESSESSETSESSEISEGIDMFEKYLAVIDPDPGVWADILRVSAPVLDRLRSGVG